MNSWILCGMQFGDEGKGTFVDYLAHEKDIDCIVRYNGGSQAAHTVITPSGVLHKFSQLGSGMFSEKCHTYITENMVVNLENLLVEMEVFSRKTRINMQDLMERIHIHENCFIVTPYHKLINKLRELSKGDNRRGTVGTGVSEVRYLLTEPKIFPYDLPLGIQVKDVFNQYSNNPIKGRIQELSRYVTEFYENNREIIWKNVPEEIEENLKKEIEFVLSPNSHINIAVNYIEKLKYARGDYNLKKCIYSIYETTLRKIGTNTIFEGSQGLLIDGTYGIKPNTTFLDTTNNFALDISYYRDNITKVGIAKAFMSRHGLGVFPTESSEVSGKIFDENQEETFWNGNVRFGWFDSLLLRYAQKVNQVDELYISSIDKLDDFEEIKICNEYIYEGNTDEKFREIFEYYISSNGQVRITDIKQSNEELGKYLEKCTPKYAFMKGWKKDLSKITDKAEIPVECMDYIKMIEILTRIPVTLISVGPTRNNKIKLAV